MAKSVTVNVRLDPEGTLLRVDEAAHAEHRSRSQMIGLLIDEALTARMRIGPPDVPGLAPALEVPPMPHVFEPQKQNALRCATCGAPAHAHR